MNHEKVGKFIAELRKEKKWTQMQLGDKVGVTDKTVSKWEKGVSAPNISILNDLSKTLGITTTELLNGEKINNLTSEEINQTMYKGINFYNRIDQKKNAKKITIIIVTMIIIFILIIAVLFINNNYNNCYIYELSSDIEGLKVDGVVTLTQEKDIIIINSIENISDYSLDSEMAYSYEYILTIANKELYKNGNIALYSHNNDDQVTPINQILGEIKLYISEDSNYDSIIQDDTFHNQNVFLKIRYINENLEIMELNIKLNLKKIFSNNKLIYDGGKKF